MKSNQNYNRELHPYAHKLRYSMTKAEACLWKYALRQKWWEDIHSTDNALLEIISLILFEETMVKDNLKEDYLKKEGYRVLRFSDKDVLTDI